MKRILFVIVILVLLAGCNCVVKDPQVVLPGWSDNMLEFGESYDVLILVGETNHFFFNTSPGWYSIPEPIESVVMCK